ncbi:hypothetical protein EDD96_7135 [Streptomyces sp. Ag109_G2-6]|nr:hypothetical protein EDD96_7135 [Streptomyces sp. Ag109_G2-6]
MRRPVSSFQLFTEFRCRDVGQAVHRLIVLPGGYPSHYDDGDPEHQETP